MESGLQEAHQEVDQTESYQLSVLAGYNRNLYWDAVWDVFSLADHWILREEQTWTI